jgi:hypothetical protein
VDVRVNERRREQEAVALDHAMPVRVEVCPELRDHAGVDADVHHLVHTGDRIEDPRAADEHVLARSVLDE